MTRSDWIAALRSGKYKQGFNCLRSGDSFCCLGVACDIRDPARWKENNGRFEFNFLSGHLNEQTRDELQLTSRQEAQLIHYNDRENLTFNQIADVLERMPIEQD